MCIIDYIKDNISWIKDLFTILFTATLTVIGILTYRRARATVLQPIRNEVIKKQVEIMTEILNFLSSHNYSTKRLYDYMSLISLNTQILLDHFELKPLTDSDKQEINKIIKGWVLFLREDRSDFVYVIGDFDDYKRTIEHVPRRSGKENIKALVENGMGGLKILFFTKHYNESYETISKYSENPILPMEVIASLMKMKYDGKLNLLLNLEEILLSYIKEYCSLTQTSSLTDESIKLLNRKTYGEFEKIRFKHEDEILQLKGVIRKHLRIDEKW